MKKRNKTIGKKVVIVIMRFCVSSFVFFCFSAVRFQHVTDTETNGLLCEEALTRGSNSTASVV